MAFFFPRESRMNTNEKDKAGVDDDRDNNNRNNKHGYNDISVASISPLPKKKLPHFFLCLLHPPT